MRGIALLVFGWSIWGLTAPGLYTLLFGPGPVALGVVTLCLVSLGLVALVAEFDAELASELEADLSSGFPEFGGRELVFGVWVSTTAWVQLLSPCTKLSWSTAGVLGTNTLMGAFAGFRCAMWEVAILLLVIFITRQVVASRNESISFVWSVGVLLFFSFGHSIFRGVAVYWGEGLSW